MHEELRLREEFEQAVAAYERAETGGDWHQREVSARAAFAVAYQLSRCYRQIGEKGQATAWGKRAGEWCDKELEAVWDEGAEEWPGSAS
jgi:hypothetical protein